MASRRVGFFTKTFTKVSYQDSYILLNFINLKALRKGFIRSLWVWPAHIPEVGMAMVEFPM